MISLQSLFVLESEHWGRDLTSSLVPDRAIVNGEPAPSVVTVMVPVAEPIEVGRKVTPRSACPPGGTV